MTHFTPGDVLVLGQGWSGSGPFQPLVVHCTADGSVIDSHDLNDPSGETASFNHISYHNGRTYITNNVGHILAYDDGWSQTIFYAAADGDLTEFGPMIWTADGDLLVENDDSGSMVIDDILRLSATGVLLQEYGSPSGIDATNPVNHMLALAPGDPCTLYWTRGTAQIHRYDLCANDDLADFFDDPSQGPDSNVSLKGVLIHPVTGNIWMSRLIVNNSGRFVSSDLRELAPDGTILGDFSLGDDIIMGNLGSMGLSLDGSMLYSGVGSFSDISNRTRLLLTNTLTGVITTKTIGSYPITSPLLPTFFIGNSTVVTAATTRRRGYAHWFA